MIAVAPPPAARHRERARVRGRVEGLVQGVGFRPFVCRLATELGVSGLVKNCADGVWIDAAGEAEPMRRFLDRLRAECPGAARFDSLESVPPEEVQRGGFVVAPSEAGGPAGPIPLDAAPCPECVAELFRPDERRHRYPFVSCAVCGPRFSIIEALPYDRVRTSMREFPLCAACEEEYQDPDDRRFHAESTSCPACGPRLTLVGAGGRPLAREGAALDRAVQAIENGAIVGVKGVGGYQLIVSACDARAVERLRERKRRPEKPFAVMVRSLGEARRFCHVDALAASALSSPRAPIVLLPRREGADVATPVAPANLDLGVLLPASPLHLLLAADARGPLVVTSANRSGDPICFHDDEAVALCSEVADLVLSHDREIVHPIDDSVVRVVDGSPRVLRAARGYAPISLPVPGTRPGVVGWGAYLKNTVAGTGRDVVRLSPHIGDLRSARSRAVAARTGSWFRRLDHAADQPACDAVDLHPEARRKDGEEATVQHHHAHVLSCMAEHDVDEPVLGIAWDGSGYGPDGTLWGGEFLVCDRRAFRRVAHLRTFPLPGADRAIVEGCRAALGLLFEMEGRQGLHDLDLASVRTFHASARRTMVRMLERGLNSPRTSSVGRLFDAFASLLDVRHRSTFEGQAALALEHAARSVGSVDPYPIPLRPKGARRPLVADWEPLVRAALNDLRAGSEVSTIAACFHEALAELVVRVAREAGLTRVALSGGCFQNQRLLERAVARLRAAGFEPLVHRRVPPNDGGVALGQVVCVARGAGAE